MTFLNFKCQNCGIDFTCSLGRVNRTIKKGYKVKFCTDKCRRIWYTEHKQGRKKVLEKYNNKESTKIYKRLWYEKKFFNGNATIMGKQCEMCGTKNDLIIHHKDGCNGRHGKPLNNSSDNLITLCRSCHPKVHNRWGLKEVVSSA